MFHTMGDIHRKEAQQFLTTIHQVIYGGNIARGMLVLFPRRETFFISDGYCDMSAFFNGTYFA